MLLSPHTYHLMIFFLLSVADFTRAYRYEARQPKPLFNLLFLAVFFLLFHFLSFYGRSKLTDTGRIPANGPVVGSAVRGRLSDPLRNQLAQRGNHFCPLFENFQTYEA